MTHVFQRFEVNGIVHPKEELSLTLNENVDIVAIYEENEMVDIKLKGSEIADVVIKIIRTTEEEITIPAGEVVTVTMDPDNDIIDVL